MILVFLQIYSVKKDLQHNNIYMQSQRILVTGPFGQVGSELIPQLQKLHGKQNVIALGHNRIPQSYDGVLERGDIKDKQAISFIIKKHGITIIYHLAALLSVTGQEKPNLAWDVNLVAHKNMLDICVENNVKRLFWASSIAVFGPTTPKASTPQHTIIEPTTMYGVTKYSCEMLSQYYTIKYNLDIRSVRYPGLLSWKQLPGNGTTDYAIDIFYQGIKSNNFECFVSEDTTLPMMYMEDAVRATLEIMLVPKQKIKIRTSYNLSAISFTAKDLVSAVKVHLPDLAVSYKPDHRSAIAASWPDSIDDSEARKDWGWKHEYDLNKLVSVMYNNLKQKLQSK